MDASSPLAYGDIWSRAQSDQSLESSCLREQKVSDKRISNDTLPQQASYGLKCWWFYSAFSHLIAVVGIIISFCTLKYIYVNRDKYYKQYLNLMYISEFNECKNIWISFRCVNKYYLLVFQLVFQFF